MFGERRNLRLLAAAITVTGLVTACKDDPAANACKTIGAAGGIISSTDGTLSLSFRPNSLGEDTEVCIAKAGRPGPPVVYGEAYRVTPDIDVDVNISVTYRAPLPRDTSLTRVGVILKEDFEQGRGRWLSLPLTRLEPENELVAGTDTRISMFYGLLDDGGEGMIDIGDSDSDSDSASGSDSDSDSATSGSSTDGPTTGSDESGSTTGGASVSDSNSNTDSDSDSDSDASTSTGDSDSDTNASTTGIVDVDCDDLLQPPFDITQIATIAPGNGEDLAMTGNGTFVIADGDTLVEMDGEGNATDWLTGLPYDEDILGLRFAPDGTLYAAMGLNGSEIYAFTPGGATVLLDSGLALSNGVHVDSAGMIWVSDYFGNSVNRIDPSGPTIEAVVTTNANNANGVFFDEQRGQVFWANYNSSQLWRAPVTGGVVGTPVGVADLAGRSDGIAMDECGNVYVVDQAAIAGDAPCRIDRVPLDANGDAAGAVVEIAGAGELGNGCANMMFGYGFGNEYDQAAFVTGQNGNIYRIQLGVGGYPLALPE